jgi:excisionase family DNA binding protein
MKLLSAQEVADLLQCNVSTVRINAGKGRYPFRMIRIGSLYKFPAEDVYQYFYGENWKECVKELGLFDEDTSDTSSSDK